MTHAVAASLPRRLPRALPAHAAVPRRGAGRLCHAVLVGRHPHHGLRRLLRRPRRGGADQPGRRRHLCLARPGAAGAAALGRRSGDRPGGADRRRGLRPAAAARRLRLLVRAHPGMDAGPRPAARGADGAGGGHRAAARGPRCLGMAAAVRRGGGVAVRPRLRAHDGARRRRPDAGEHRRGREPQRARRERRPDAAGDRLLRQPAAARLLPRRAAAFPARAAVRRPRRHPVPHLLRRLGAAARRCRGWPCRRAGPWCWSASAASPWSA